MDLVMTELCSALPVDMMPGAEDPTNVALPQQPLHRCLLPAAVSYGSLARVTNPHAFDVDGVAFLGTSGQNIEDVSKYSRHADRLSRRMRSSRGDMALAGLRPLLTSRPAGLGWRSTG
eukprot:364340-Chlamydomonas_euryale.AAC.2